MRGSLRSAWAYLLIPITMILQKEREEALLVTLLGWGVECPGVNCPNECTKPSSG